MYIGIQKAYSCQQNYRRVMERFNMITEEQICRVKDIICSIKFYMPHDCHHYAYSARLVDRIKAGWKITENSSTPYSIRAVSKRGNRPVNGYCPPCGMVF